MPVTGNMESRKTILESLRNRLRTMTQDLAAAPQPPIPKVWPVTLSPTDVTSINTLSAQFIESLTAVAGEAVRVPDAAAAATIIAKLMCETDAAGCTTVQKPLAYDVWNRLPNDRRIEWNPEWTPPEMAEVPMAIVEAEQLLADTGSSVVVSRDTAQRLACYLPPTCVVVASVDRLCENISAAWEELMQRAAQPETRGEFVLITGPSRTADIEQVLVLGVHGPRRLKVILIG